MSKSIVPPNPADLDTRHADALAREHVRIYEYLARVARAAAAVVDELIDEAERLADAAGDDERAEYDAAAADVADAADLARSAAFRATEYAAEAVHHVELAYAAEDIEPAAIAEVAVELATALAAALEAVPRTAI